MTDTSTDVIDNDYFNRFKASKVLVLFIFVFILILIFLGKLTMTVITDRSAPSTQKIVQDRAKRGAIISSDGYAVASTQKVYKAIINTKNLDPDKKNLFITLFSIYSEVSPNIIKKKISSAKGRVILSYNIDAQKAKHLKALAHKLLRLKVFKRYETEDKRVILQGLDILESGETRSYPYNDLLTPIIGYIHKYEQDDYTRVNGIKGIENSYQDLLESRVNGKKQAERDVNNYLILNKASTILRTQDGPSLVLNIPLELQRRTEHMLSMAKKDYNAKEILCSIMESKSGKVLVLASSNRFDPKEIRKSDYPSLNANIIEYTFEPGSVIKPLVFAKLLEKKKIAPLDIINTHNGRFILGNTVITDDHKSKYLSAENVIVHSSNIGMAQMVQKLGALELHQALLDFGLTQPTHLDLPYEKVGSLPSIPQLSNQIYKATTSYGYGLLVNFMQLMKAYNVFNNQGEMVRPQIVAFLDKEGKKSPLSQHKNESVLSPFVAQRMKKILIKAVKEGTGIAANFPGLEIGGKTGTAHIAEKGSYVKKYNSSFFGFANDNKHAYTIGVTVIEPNEHVYFAATSAVPLFKKLTELLIEFEYLSPK